MRIHPFLAGLALFLAVAGPVAASDQVPLIRLAQAEEPPKRPGLFRFLFGGSNRDQNAAPPAETRKAAPKRSTRPRATRRNRSSGTAKRRSGGTKARIVSAPKPAYDGPVSNVLVVGDFMAQALSGGLVAAFQDSPEIQIVNAAEGASGLVRIDYFDWIAELRALVARYEPAAIVVMVGANDSQPFRTDAGRIQPGSEEWRAAYVARVRAFVAALAETETPAIWAGLVPISKAKLSRAYSEFNTIYQETASAAAMPFVPLWDGFADDQGRFAASGPDINGQTRRLRINDGLNFTSAGKRKLAFFLEQNIRQIIRDGTVPQFAAATQRNAASRARISPMIALDTLSVPAGAELATFPQPEPAAETAAAPDNAPENAPDNAPENAIDDATGNAEVTGPGPAADSHADSGRNSGLDPELGPGTGGSIGSEKTKIAAADQAASPVNAPDSTDIRIPVRQAGRKPDDAGPQNGGTGDRALADGPPPPGRVDNYAWPRTQPAPPSAVTAEATAAGTGPTSAAAAKSP